MPINPTSKTGLYYSVTDQGVDVSTVYSNLSEYQEGKQGFVASGVVDTKTGNIIGIQPRTIINGKASGGGKYSGSLRALRYGYFPKQEYIPPQPQPTPQNFTPLEPVDTRPTMQEVINPTSEVQPSKQVVTQLIKETKGTDIAKFYATGGKEGLPFQFDKTYNQPIYDSSGKKVASKTGTIGYEGREYTSYTLEPSPNDLKNQSKNFSQSLSSNTNIIRGGSSVIYTQPKMPTSPSEVASPPASEGLNFTPMYGYTGLKGETVIYNYETVKQEKPYFSTPVAQYLYSKNAKVPAYILSGAETTIYGAKQFGKDFLKATFPNTEYIGYKFNDKIYGINLEGASAKRGVIGTGIIAAQFTPLALPVDVYFVGKGGYDIYSGVKEKSGQKITEGALQSLSIFGIRQGLKPIKNIYVRAGSEFVAPEKVFAESVLSGKETMPTISSIPKSLELFNKPISGEIKVISSSPSKIAGEVAGESRKSLLGLEDPGIYVTPYGKGSPAFLRVIDDTTKIEIGSGSILSDINPKNIFSLPTVSSFNVKSVVLQPRNVVESAGFSATKRFFEETGSKTGQAFITKRSEIGQGSVKRIYEAGTTEIEAVIPYKAKFKLSSTSIKGFSQYTTYKGYNIPIREYELIQVKNEIKKSAFSKENKFKPIEELSILKDYSYLKRSSTASKILSNISKTSMLYSKSSISKVSTTSSIYSTKSTMPSKTTSKTSSISNIYNKSTISKLSDTSLIYSGYSKISTPYPTKSTISKVTSKTSKSIIQPPNERKISFGKQQKKQSFKILSKPIYQPKKYTPTVTSIAYKIKGKESKLLTTSGFSGRPL